jgi:hypothetical protein
VFADTEEGDAIPVFQHNIMEMNGELDVRLHAFLILALNGGELSATLPPRFASGESSFNPRGQKVRLRPAAIINFLHPIY